MKIAIRMDDITPDMDWERFLRFKELCGLYQVKPLIGVVPDNQDVMLQIDEPKADFWEYVRGLQQDGWCIAQHGCKHVYGTHSKGCFPLNAFSEYAGVSYEEQYASLQRGQQILREQNIVTDIFMAPAHSYDTNTLKALRKLGFTKMTDGFGSVPYEWKGLTFYPISFQQSRSLVQKEGYTTLVVHTNTMREQDFDRYEKIFAEHRNDLFSYRDYLDIVPKKRGTCGHVKEYLMAYTKRLLVNLKAK